LGTELGRDALNHVVSITGVKGNPQPEKWKIVLEDPNGRGVREVDVSDGKIGSEHRPGRSVAGSTAGATLDTSRLNMDSSGAYEVASHTADLSHANFATVDYTLRTDERGEPTWIVTLLSSSSRPVGTLHIGAMRGRRRTAAAAAAGILVTIAFYTRLNNLIMAAGVAVFALPLQVSMRDLLRPAGWWRRMMAFSRSGSL